MDYKDLAKQHGFQIVREFDAVSAQAVFLAQKGWNYYVIKWPEQNWNEREALQIWSGNAGPQFYDLDPGFFALQYLSGRNPYYWSDEDFPKILDLLQKMQTNQPEDLRDFRPIEDLVSKIHRKILASPLPQKEEAAQALLQSLKATEKRSMIHGDLHPWNIFMRDAAHLIDPYGVCGDPGFDVAFLAASLANNQEDFLRRAAKELSLPSAELWFPGLVAYRLDCALRYQEHSEARVLQNLSERIWGA